MGLENGLGQVGGRGAYDETAVGGGCGGRKRSKERERSSSSEAYLTKLSRTTSLEGRALAWDSGDGSFILGSAVGILGYLGWGISVCCASVSVTLSPF